MTCEREGTGNERYREGDWDAGANRKACGRKIGAIAGIPAMGLDGLGSSAYGPEAALTILIPAGALGLQVITPIMAMILLRRRQLLADGVPVELGTRACEVLLALMEADGALVTKEELLRRVWPGNVVSEGNLKVQMSVLRSAPGPDRNLIHTEFGRGYHFTGILRSNATAHA